MLSVIPQLSIKYHYLDFVLDFNSNKYISMEFSTPLLCNVSCMIYGEVTIDATNGTIYAQIIPGIKLDVSESNNCTCASLIE